MTLLCVVFVVVRVCWGGGQVRSECLKDLKNRLIEKANRIQARFDSETAELQVTLACLHTYVDAGLMRADAYKAFVSL